MSTTILLDKIGAVGKITLNRPESFNSFNEEMSLAMQAALENCDKDPAIRAIFITGNGKAFSAGQDIKEVLDPNVTFGLEHIIEHHFNPIVQKIFDIDIPVICGVNGVAAGAGANLALICDITLATESASFIQAFSKIGLVPDSGGSYALPRLIGFQKAIALALTGDKVKAPEAERMGMIYKYFPDDGFENQAFAVAEKLSKMPTKSLGYIKALFNRSLTNSFEEQLELEKIYQKMAGDTSDHQEGMQAFVEKREAIFKGE